MKTFNLTVLMLFTLLFSALTYANYDRNRAVPVEKVLFGKVISVRNITQEELVQDKNSGWKTFGGALIGGVIGNQFGGGSGRDVATILGAIIGGSITSEHNNQPRRIVTSLVELMLSVNNGEQFMVIQDFDQQMVFHSRDKVRMIYLANGSVRIDKQF
jgi:outer membrane lipoprotein SlyB